MKITITKIVFKDKDKDGKPYMGKNGPYTRIGLQCTEYGPNKWLSGFLNKSNERWKEGDTVDVDIDPVLRNGKEYLNFRSVGRLELLERRVYELEQKLKHYGNTSPNVSDATEDEPDFDDINAELAGSKN